MTTATLEGKPVKVEIQESVRQEAGQVEGHMKAFIDLAVSFEDLHAQRHEMLLGRLLDGRLRIVEPFRVALSSESGQFIADATEVGEVGVGSTQSEAVRDLQATLGELYIGLESDHDRLGGEMLKVWAVMQKKVEKKA